MIDRLTGLKARSGSMADYIETLPGYNESRQLQKVHGDVKGCASWLVIHDYYQIQQRRLVGAQTCKKHLLCPFCAVGRGSRMMAKAMPKLEHVVETRPNLIPVHIVLTVKNRDELRPVAHHCLSSLRKLIQRRRDGIKGTITSEAAKVAGALYSVETTHDEETGWHPHVHMLAFLEDYIDQEALSREWHHITGDSYIVHVERVKSHREGRNHVTLVDALSEVAKYAVKLSGLPEADAWEAYQVFTRKRLVGTLGCLRGIPLTDEVLDDPIEAEPYVRLLYRWTGRNYHMDTDQILTVANPLSRSDRETDPAPTG